MLILPACPWKRTTLLIAALFYIVAGITHFTNSEFFVSIMPNWLPFHLELVWLSGAAEMILGAALLSSRWRQKASWGLIVLLIAVFPANLHMAMNPELFVLRGTPLWGLYLRLPIQVVLIAWAWWIGKPDPAPE
jgi:uncharacterized membrane protein